MTEYERIRAELERHYANLWVTHDTYWISNRIVWAYKFRHINKFERDRLIDMVLGLTDPNVYFDFETETLRYIDDDQVVKFS